MTTMTAERKLTTQKAIAEAVAQEMERDETVFVMGEDIGVYGGIFGATEGLLDRFGPERVMDTPISETGFMPDVEVYTEDLPEAPAAEQLEPAVIDVEPIEEGDEAEQDADPATGTGEVTAGV